MIKTFFIIKIKISIVDKMPLIEIHANPGECIDQDVYFESNYYCKDTVVFFLPGCLSYTEYFQKVFDNTRVFSIDLDYFNFIKSKDKRPDVYNFKYLYLETIGSDIECILDCPHCNLQCR